MVAIGHRPKVAVLLATCNGAAYLTEQLASVAGQQDVDIDLIASDDGSVDDTRTILDLWRARWAGRFEILDGPQQGFAANFRSLALRATQDADFVAFSDQDDLWDKDKLTTAIRILSQNSAVRPGLYFSRTRLISADTRPLGFSPLFKRVPSFRNAIVQSIGGGNTIVFNRQAFALFAESARRTTFETHDWWAYIICSGAGAFVHYDPSSHIAYRQHKGNLVGKNTGFTARLNRLNLILQGRFASWTDGNLEALDRCVDLLTPEARTVIAMMRRIRRSRMLGAVGLLRQSGIYRQTLAGNIALAAAAAIGKL